MCITVQPSAPFDNNEGMMIRMEIEIDPIGRRNVRFDSDVQIFHIPNRGDNTVEEIQACNYSEKEFGEIRQRERRLTRQLSRLGAVIDVDEDELGLESSQAKSRRKLRMQEGQMSVLLEQTLQNDVNQRDAEYIASIYSHYTRESSTLAHNRGLRVAEHVKIINFCDSSSHIWQKEQSQHTPQVVHSSRWRSSTTDRAPLAPMAHIMTERQINAWKNQPPPPPPPPLMDRLETSKMTHHPWEQCINCKHVPCETNAETIHIRSRWYRVD